MKNKRLFKKKKKKEPGQIPKVNKLHFNLIFNKWFPRTAVKDKLYFYVTSLFNSKKKGGRRKEII